MLNFNRFTYRRKAALDFLSRKQNKSDGNTSSQSQENICSGSGNELTAQVADVSSLKTRPTFATGEDVNRDAKDVLAEEERNTKSCGKAWEKSKCNEQVKEDALKKTQSFTDQLSEKRSEKTSEGDAAKGSTLYAEEKLRDLLSNGPMFRFSSSSEKCLLGNKKDVKEKNDSFKRKRKELCDKSNEKGQNGISHFNNMKENSYQVKSRSPSSYECFVPKSKRKRVFLLEDSDDDSERPNQKSSTHKEKCDTSFAKESEEIKNDIEKLREVYSHLSISEAREALDLAGSLTDAILNLADTLNTEESHIVDKKESIVLSQTSLGKKDKASKVKPPIEHNEAPSKASKGCSTIVLDSDEVDTSPGEGTDESEYEGEEQSSEVIEQQRCILSFFQDASVADIGSVPGFSEKKATDIFQKRPFKDYDDLITKLSSVKGCKERALENVLDFMKERKMVDELMEDCQGIASRINKAIRNIANLEEDGDSTNIDFQDHAFISDQPKILNSSLELKNYQLAGLNWLVTLHKEGVNGILADEMGLGKTIQALAFIGHLIETGNPGPHVIIVPSSTFDNWIREIDTWLPSVSYMEYIGAQDERVALRQEILYGDNEYNIIISTYNIAISNAKDRSLFKKLKSHYVILDEGHMLKNMKSNRYKYLAEIRAPRRLLLTGTPVQNNLLEMMSLLNFLMPELFVDRLNALVMLFGTKSKSDYHGRIVDTAKQILKPFMLKRTKDTVLKDLPTKTEKLVYCEMAERQKYLYDLMLQKFKMLASDKSHNAVVELMQLRKVADHPLLERNLYSKAKLKEMAATYIKQYENQESCFEYVLEDMEAMSDFELHSFCHEKYYLSKYCLKTEAVLCSGKFKQLDKLLPQLKMKGSRVLIFSQFTMLLDILEEYVKKNSHSYLRLDGKTPVSTRLSLIDKYNNDRKIFIFLLSTLAGGLGINLTSADTVIMHDLHFNPTMDKQAQDRCHRVGQTRDVTIYKLVSKNTIEENILECANSKLILEKNVAQNFEEDDSTPADITKYLITSLQKNTTE